TIIYETMLTLYEKHQPIDFLSVSSKLKEAEALEDVGGRSYLTQLVESVPTSAHINHYAKIVKEKKVLRDLINASAEISETAFKETNDLETLLDDVEQKIFSISQQSIPQTFVHIKEELNVAYERIERLARGERPIRGLSTGFPELDGILSGIQNSNLIVVGARPSLGKTSFALDIARHIATKEEKPVGIFSLEMSREEIVDRMIAAESNVPLWRLRTGRITDETDFTLIQTALDALSRAPIYIHDMPTSNIMQIRSIARRLQSQHGLSALIVDYLQLIQPRTNSDNVVQQITEISRGLKALARELNIPVIALSQLSRNVEQREIKIPRLADLRDSGSIEQDSDVVIFLYRKDRDKLHPTSEEENLAEIIVAKHRNGPLGTIKLKFDQDKVSFRSLDTRHLDN
ncbi:MAG: replicative DNA helicase, partial [Patescibacteria group bacterium]